MSFIKKEWLNRCLFLGVGLLLGFQLNSLNDDTEKSTMETTEDVTAQFESAVDSEVKLQQLIEQTIRDELSRNLISYRTASTDALSANKISTDAASTDKSMNQSAYAYHNAQDKSLNNQTADTSVHYQTISRSQPAATEQQQRNYQAADLLVDNAINSGNWDTDIAKQLVSHLNSLTTEQELAIRVKYANAINQGMITPESPLDMVGME